MSEWIKALSDFMQEKAEKVPKGFKTIEQIAKEIGLNRRTVNERINELKKINENLVDTKKFLVFKNGKTYPIPHYKLKKK